MRKPYDRQYLTEVLEAQLAAIVAHHTEMANLEWECARLLERRRLHGRSDQSDDDDDDDGNEDHHRPTEHS
jgi:hypothetical protein